jgi:hypothetical protein
MLNSLKEIIESYRNVDEEFEKVEYLSKWHLFEFMLLLFA